MQFTKPQHYKAVIEKKEQLTNDVILVTFALLEPSTISFIAGQTIMLNVAPGINRAMSIASPPSDTGHILMLHDIRPGGPGSQWTINHKEGDEASFIAPLGMFVMNAESSRKKVFVATGTGVAPFHAMLLEYLPKGQTDEVTLYWGLRYEADIYWKDEFEQLAKRYTYFHFVLTLSKPSDRWQESASQRRGHVTDHVVQNEQNVKGCEFYLCGNQMMIKEMEHQLLTAGVSSEQIRKDPYF